MIEEKKDDKITQVRDNFISLYGNRKLLPMICCACGKSGGTITWHFSGFTFHKEHLPEDDEVAKRVIRLSKKDYDFLMDELTKPPKVNEKLLEAFKRYKSVFKEKE